MILAIHLHKRSYDRRDFPTCSVLEWHRPGWRGRRSSGRRPASRCACLTSGPGCVKNVLLLLSLGGPVCSVPFKPVVGGRRQSGHLLHARETVVPNAAWLEVSPGVKLKNADARAPILGQLNQNSGDPYFRKASPLVLKSSQGWKPRRLALFINQITATVYWVTTAYEALYYALGQVIFFFSPTFIGKFLM